MRRGMSACFRIGAPAALLALVVSVLPALAAFPARAASGTVVSLEFDDGSAGQYTLAYQRALQPHGATATFFVKSGTIGNSGNMTWTQVQALAAAGNDIGGKTVNSANLTTDPNPTAQVCNDRQALIQHGLTPVAFAYPGGAYNSTVQTIVKNCGYGNARSAGGVSASGPTYADTVPPANLLATKAWTPPTAASAETQLSDMEAEVSAAAAHGGGLVQIILYRVCSQTYDPNNYTSCLGSSRPVELNTVNGFLDWMAERRPDRRSPRRCHAQHRAERHHRRRHHGPGNDHRLQWRCLLDQHLHGFGLGDAGRHRHGLGGREHPLHHRRLGPHAVQPHLHRPVPGGGHGDRAVRLVGLRGQRRDRALQDDHGAAAVSGHHAADHHDLV